MDKINILLIYFLIPRYGVNGYIIVIFISAFINTALSVNCLISMTEISFSVIDSILKPLLISIISSFIILIIFAQLEMQNQVVKAILQTVLMSTTYLSLLYLTKTIKPVHKGI